MERNSVEIREKERFASHVERREEENIENEEEIANDEIQNEEEEGAKEEILDEQQDEMGDDEEDTVVDSESFAFKKMVEKNETIVQLEAFFFLEQDRSEASYNFCLKNKGTMIAVHEKLAQRIPAVYLPVFTDSKEVLMSVTRLRLFRGFSKNISGNELS